MYQKVTPWILSRLLEFARSTPLTLKSSPPPHHHHDLLLVRENQ